MADLWPGSKGGVTWRYGGLRHVSGRGLSRPCASSLFWFCRVSRHNLVVKSKMKHELCWNCCELCDGRCCRSIDAFQVVDFMRKRFHGLRLSMTLLYFHPLTSTGTLSPPTAHRPPPTALFSESIDLWGENRKIASLSLSLSLYKFRRGFFSGFFLNGDGFFSRK